jgi:hypothetical protein
MANKCFQSRGANYEAVFARLPPYRQWKSAVHPKVKSASDVFESTVISQTRMQLANKR